MQVSAINTLIAAQQARTAQTIRPAATAPAVQKNVAPEPAQGFEPLAFAQPATETAAGNTPAKPTYPAGAALGSQVDIRV